MSSPPKIAMRYPVVRPGRLPFAAMTRATTRAASAPPRVWAVPPRPAQVSLPDTSAASRAPTAAPALTPTPPRTCDPARVVTVRRCRAGMLTEGSMTRTLSRGVVASPHRAGPP